LAIQTQWYIAETQLEHLALLSNGDEKNPNSEAQENYRRGGLRKTKQRLGHRATTIIETSWRDHPIIKNKSVCKHLGGPGL